MAAHPIPPLPAVGRGWERGLGGVGGRAAGPILATAAGFGSVSETALARATGTAEVLGASTATLIGTVQRTAVESLTGPSIAYDLAVRLDGRWIPPADLLGPFEFDASIDTVVSLFSFGLTGRRWSVEATSKTWTRTPVEIWATAGPIGAVRTWLRAFGTVVSCEQTSGLEPTLRVHCADPSQLTAGLELCEEIPAGAGLDPLTRGTICRRILNDVAGLAADVPDGALITKPVVTDSRHLWTWLRDFGEPERWAWRFRDPSTVEAYPVALRQPPEPPDDVWTLAGVVSIETAPPNHVPSRLVIRSTEVVGAGDGLHVETTRTEVKALYAARQAVAMQHADGTIVPVSVSDTPPPQTLQTISILEVEQHTLAGRLVTQITREWGWYNPRAAKLRSLGFPPGPVEDGYYWAEAFVDEDGRYRTWRQEAFVQTGEKRETPTYDGDGTEIARRTETSRWHARTMGTRSVGSDHPSVLGAGVGDDGISYYPFQTALSALLVLEAFGLAQVDEISREFGDDGAELARTQTTQAWYSPRTAVTGVPWFVNYSGSGQRDLVAPFQEVARRTTRNRLIGGLLSGTLETTQTFAAPRRPGGFYDFGDHKSNVLSETLTTTGIKTTTYNVLDDNTYEEVLDDGAGAQTRTVMGRPPRPLYRASAWTQTLQTPIEILLEDPVAESWWGPATEIVTVEAAQTREEALSVALWRRSRKLAFTHTVIRPPCPIRPGQTVLLLDPRQGLSHRCLVTQQTERWILAPRPQILATYTLEQPL
jgi:hypothetical protein